MLEDIKDIKEALFSFNVANDISKKLNYINKKRDHIQLLESYLLKSKGVQNSLEDTVSRLKKLKDSVFERNEDFVFEYQFWDKPQLEKELKEIKSTVLAYEEQISYINANKTLTLSLYESSIELLGL